MTKSIFIKTSIIALAGFFSSTSFAKKGAPATEAMYVVPTDASLVAHSRFTVEIRKGYRDVNTTVIAYVFPEILVGEANRVIEFQRIPDMYGSNTSSWLTDGARADCTIIHETFSCNISLEKSSSGVGLLDLIVNKAFAQNLTSPFSESRALANIKTMGAIPAADLTSLEEVVKAFYSHEPAGILSYEIN